EPHQREMRRSGSVCYSPRRRTVFERHPPCVEAEARGRWDPPPPELVRNRGVLPGIRVASLPDPLVCTLFARTHFRPDRVWVYRHKTWLLRGFRESGPRASNPRPSAWEISTHVL